MTMNSLVQTLMKVILDGSRNLVASAYMVVLETTKVGEIFPESKYREKRIHQNL
jgi:hypothetical protein